MYIVASLAAICLLSSLLSTQEVINYIHFVSSRMHLLKEYVLCRFTNLYIRSFAVTSEEYVGLQKCNARQSI